MPQFRRRFSFWPQVVIGRASMSQITITGNPTFEGIKYLVEMLPKGDRNALRNYLTLPDAEGSEKELDEVISRFRAHGHTEQEMEDAVVRAMRQVRDTKAAENT